MKNLAGGLVAAALTAATVAGCGAAADSTDQPQPEQVTETATPAKTKPTFTAAEQHYLDDLAAVDPAYDATPKSRRWAIRVGHATCHALDTGVTFDDLAQTSRETLTPEERLVAASTLLAATERLCPEYRAAFRSWLS